jgi:oligosaccharide repeat unit polymerase
LIWIWDLLLLVLVVKVDHLISGRRYTPLTLFAVCWLLPLALRHLNLVEYEAFTAKTFLMVYGGFLSFALGYILVLTVAKRFWKPLSDEKLAEHIDEKALTFTIVFVTSLGLIATFVQVSTVVATYGLIGFLSNPLEVREEFMLTGWGALYLLNALLPGLIILRHKKRGGKADRFTITMLIIVVVVLIIANQKQALVKAVVAASVMATLFEHHVKVRSLVVAALALLMFFVGYARVTSPYYEGDHRFYVRDGHIHLPQALAPLGNPYHYITSGFGNFQVFTDDLDYFKDGRQSMRPFRYLWLRLQGSREIESHHGRFYYAPLFGNTHTYLRQFYADGGVPGVLLLSCLLGIVCCLVFVEIVFRGRIWLAPIYGIIGWCLFISFFSNHWVYFGTWMLFSFALILGLCISLRNTIGRYYARRAITSSD